MHAYKIVLVRHGESVWNKENRFTGWVDVALTPRGEAEALEAGKRLKSAGFAFDIAFTSYLKRAVETLDLILSEMGISEIEIRKSWKLNERHYGALQGLNKSETAELYGEEQVKLWRRGYDVSIPELAKDSPMYPGNEPLYSDLKPEEIPTWENLKMVVERIVPYWIEEIVPEIKKKKNIIISASGNSLRALAKYLERISDEAISELNIPTGIPFVYEFNENLELLKKYYLASDEELKTAIKRVAGQGRASH